METVSASISSQATQAPHPGLPGKGKYRQEGCRDCQLPVLPSYLPVGNSTQHSGRGSGGPAELMAGSFQRLVWHHLRSGEIQRRLGQETLETAPLPWDKIRHHLKPASHGLRWKVTVLRVTHKVLVKLTSALLPPLNTIGINKSLTLSNYVAETGFKKAPRNLKLSHSTPRLEQQHYVGVHGGKALPITVKGVSASSRPLDMF